MNQPLLTIAIPTYNGSKTICNMLDLLLPQCTSEVEVLICDNCSTDGTSELIRDYILSYPFIRYIKNSSNIGADGNFLKCMQEASGRYIHLLSDDDILIEGSLEYIISFLKKNPAMGLVYLSTVDFKNKYESLEKCIDTTTYAAEDICTKNRILFMKYASQYWGFVSSFIINREQFNKIDNPQQYFGTYWLQSYIHILCTSGDAFLGIVSRKSIGAGVYQQQSNFDVATVDGVNYRQMLDFAVKYGFNAKQLDNWFVRRICLVAGHGIVKEKATGNKKINKRILFKCTKNYWQAWLKIYPLIFVPSFICRLVLGGCRKRAGASYNAVTSRTGDVETKRS